NGGTATATATITLTGVNDAPLAEADTVMTDEDTVLSGDVLVDNGGGADSDPDADPLTVSAVNGQAANVGSPITLASGAQLTVNADGTFVYDPTTSASLQSLPAGANTTDTFTYTVDDGNGGTATGTVTVTVTGVNDPPTAVDTVGVNLPGVSSTSFVSGSIPEPQSPAPIPELFPGSDVQFRIGRGVLSAADTDVFDGDEDGIQYLDRLLAFDTDERLSDPSRVVYGSDISLYIDPTVNDRWNEIDDQYGAGRAEETIRYTALEGVVGAAAADKQVQPEADRTPLNIDACTIPGNAGECLPATDVFRIQGGAVRLTDQLASADEFERDLARFISLLDGQAVRDSTG
ncbi:MAG: Ig-like domain-containing protein, partial [Gammaproteobacteria bacterium]|nr:Ig-like domain-containing protein [Gammaproteobacteria bacterium]